MGAEAEGLRATSTYNCATSKKRRAATLNAPNKIGRNTLKRKCDLEDVVRRYRMRQMGQNMLEIGHKIRIDRSHWPKVFEGHLDRHGLDE